MNGNSPALAASSETDAHRSATWFALAIALGAGVTAFVSPALSLLVLAALAAHALIRAETIRFEPLSLAGPVFAALVVGAFMGLAAGVGVLFVWRMFADTRWSISEAQRLALAAGRPGENTRRALLHVWTTPFFGLALVAYTAPHMVAGLPLDLPHVPIWVPIAAAALAAIAIVDWALQRAADWRLGELAAAPARHLLAHHILFILAFGLMIDVSAGIVAMAAWRLIHAAPLRQPSLTAVP